MGGFMPITTAAQILCRTNFLTDEELFKIRRKAEMLFAKAKKTADETMRLLESEVKKQRA